MITEYWICMRKYFISARYTFVEYKKWFMKIKCWWIRKDYWMYIILNNWGKHGWFGGSRTLSITGSQHELNIFAESHSNWIKTQGLYIHPNTLWKDHREKHDNMILDVHKKYWITRSLCNWIQACTWCVTEKTIHQNWKNYWKKVHNTEKLVLWITESNGVHK